MNLMESYHQKYLLMKILFNKIKKVFILDQKIIKLNYNGLVLYQIFLICLVI